MGKNNKYIPNIRLDTGRLEKAGIAIVYLFGSYVEAGPDFQGDIDIGMRIEEAILNIKNQNVKLLKIVNWSKTK